MTKSLCFSYRLLSSLSVLSLLINPASAADIGVLDAKSTTTNLATSAVKGFNPSVNIMTAIPTANEQGIKEDNPEIYFSADEVENNQELSTVTALGNVEIIRNKLTLKADKVIYNQKDDIVTAIGNVVMVEEDGNVVFSDYVELTDQMSQGEMKNIKIIMADKTRIAASTFHRGEKDKKIMTNVVYSPCDTCKNNENPLWQIKARKVEHNAETQDVNYQNATLEVKGVPVFYTPFLSHPDPSVKRRSGFLFPRIMSNSYLGAAIQPQYFWNISDNEDLLFSPVFASDKGVIPGGTYNKYFDRGEMHVSGSYLHDLDSKENRGYMFGEARYEVNDFWVADTDINYASDNSYLRDLSLPKKYDAWLTSRARLQGFDNRNYATAEGYYYRLQSYDLSSSTKPTVLPYLEYENISNPDQYGAYAKNTFSFASVDWEDDDDKEGDSSQRATMINSWNLPYTSPYGEKYRMVASVKSDLYYVNNYVYENDPTYDGTTARVFPQMGLEWRLPFVRATESSRQILEPIVVAVAAPNNGNKTDEIPNQDSQDVELNDTNILDLDRYAGYDRNDVGSRVSYGVNWSAYGNEYGRTSIFLAQSYEFDKEDSFASSESNTGNLTDYVGRVYASPNEYFDMNYRFKLDKDNLDINYSELSAQMGPKILNAYVSYIYFKDNPYTSSIADNSDRKELYTSLNVQVTRDWSVSVFNRQDLGDFSGSLEHGGTLTYEDECSRFDITIRQEDSNDPEFEGDTAFTFSFFLKTLGGAASK